jgi:hypothetical protein
MEQLEQFFDFGAVFRLWNDFLPLEQFFGPGAVFCPWNSF